MAAVLGIGGSDHDVHSCLLQDGRILVAIEEERLSRKKYGLGGNLLEGLSRRYCLDAAGLRLGEVDAVVVDSILAPTALAGCRHRAQPIDHHLAHAAAAWLTSGFETGAVLVVDNAGDLVQEGACSGLQATSWYHGQGRDLHLLKQVLSTHWKEGPGCMGKPYQRGDGNHSLGHFYKKISGALGFRYPPDETGGNGFFYPEDGKTMGLAAYGDLRHLERLWALVKLLPNGGYRIPLTDGRLDALLREWLLPDAGFEERAAVAAAAQEVLTRLLCHLVEYSLTTTGETRLCLAGGVAMNSMANGEILRRTAVEKLYVPPMPGDNGTGIGAALWTVSRDPRVALPEFSVYSGRAYSPGEVRRAIAGLDRERFVIREMDGQPLLREVAERLARGQVVGWFEGGSESGRRALGHRSLLADPRDPEMRDHLNRDVKRREPFRPFAPVVLEARAGELFELPQSSPYMQIVARVRLDQRRELQAVTHIDGTARVQTVRADQQPRLHGLLEEFDRQAGVPVLLNTSFNGYGAPIVETPEDALRCFLEMPVAALVLEDKLVVKL
jgi:carbamoyltransferase